MTDRIIWSKPKPMKDVIRNYGLGIRVTLSTKDKLKHLKLRKGESFDEVIQRLIKHLDGEKVKR